MNKIVKIKKDTGIRFCCCYLSSVVRKKERIILRTKIMYKIVEKYTFENYKIEKLWSKMSN